MSHTLLSISIGPVQEFIAASRKARDLWRGSSLLSDISRDAALGIRAAAADGEVEMIFPAPEAIDAPAGMRIAVANKLLVLVKGDAARAQHLAEASHQAARESLANAWDSVWRDVDHVASWLDKDLSDAQVEHFLEFYAAWWPVPNPEDDYAEARTQVERLLAGRKALRDFAPSVAGARNRAKSSLDPARESIIKRNTPTDQYNVVQRALHLRGNEQLDAVSLIKRRSKRRIVSTSRMAIDPFIRRIAPDPQHVPQELLELQRHASSLQHTDLAEEFAIDPISRLDHFRAFPFDSQIFYGLPREVDAADSPFTPEEQKAARAFLTTTQALLKHHGVREAPTAYAILVADGDNMGKAINEMRTLAHNVAFSAILNRFAQKADSIVRTHNGALLYSGGDDVVAFLPVDTAIPCVASLRKAFRSLMQEARDSVEFQTLPTLSAGLAIVHFREHLQVAMSWAREAERAAKNAPGKNALAVHLHTHSGGAEAVKVVHTWSDDLLEERWGRWVRLHMLNDIPDAVPFALHDLHRELKAMRLPKDLLPVVLRAEVKRILERRRRQYGSSPMQKADIQAILGLAGSNLETLDQVVNEILIARRLASAVSIGGETALRVWNPCLTTKITITPAVREEVSV